MKRGILGELMISRVRAVTSEAFAKWRNSSEVRGILKKCRQAAALTLIIKPIMRGFDRKVLGQAF